MLAVATCLTGLTEKAIFELGYVMTVVFGLVLVTDF
jgi:hypothetical protein